jgi:hypothetical protein
MEGALRASEPHLTSMYAIFARLNAGEPVGAEQLARKRLRWLQPGTAMYAIVLIPVMFAGARNATACKASYSVGGVSPLTSHPSCAVSAKATVAKNAVRKKISVTARLACATTGQAARLTTLTGNEQALSPAARAYAAAAGPPGMC